MRTVRTMAAVLVAGVAMAWAPSALATDRITLKSGEVIEGTIENELNGYVWFSTRVGGIVQSRTLAPEDIASIERNIEAGGATGGATTPTPAPMPSPVPTPAEVIDDESITKGVVLSLGGPEGDMVGLYMAAKPLREVMPELIEQGVDVVVFHVNSGGGMVIEIEHLVETIKEYKEHFRVVAWIDRAISAAAMTSHVVEDIYFKTGGTYGACTAFRGPNDVMEGRELEELMYFMEQVSAWGQKSPYIMRAMEINEPLSCDIDENGDVTWYQSLDGEIIANNGQYILTFNSDLAERTGFSRGTADTLDELTSQLQMGEIHWIGEFEQNVAYPVSDAEQHQIDFRLMVKRSEERMTEFFNKYRMARGAINGDQQTKAAMGQRALQALAEIKRMVENNPNFGLMIGFPTIEEFRDWYEQQVEEVRDLMR